ncbi:MULTISPECIES: type III PLP-dependent enzyme [unclassified Streptomyces]|uniref:type III PLP-dependent enzyme n=1 Tax=unclassified Streptomyces TaxID=2593676 RepID=UPI00074ADBA7|nr:MULTISPECIES: type III PLP-dependent enzyme [unclassified Streptomyces]KUL48435.1 diaminopimelate decarboxylase [Streptomyces sp. NRRL S-1521]THC50452.1 type III PLP-dependent enzyme [Streptomyces sp. A1499]
MSVAFEVQGIGITDLAAEFGTPMYLYDGEEIRGRFANLRAELHDRLEVFYSLKANPNVSICSLLHTCGARAEVSSLTELVTARRAGVAPRDIIFLGPGKSRSEIEACVDEGVYAIVCESLGELELIDEVARERGVTAPVALRVNPSFSVKGSGLTMGGKPRQFGMDEEQLLKEHGLAARFPGVRLMGVQVYLGTRILGEETVAENTRRILELAERVGSTLGFGLEMVDIGGGLGIAYFDNEKDLDVAELARLVNPLIQEFAARHPETRMIMELGRFLTAASGTYVTRVRYTKTSMGEKFAVTDGGTNHHMAAVGIGSYVKRNFPIVALERLDEPADGPWNVTGPLCTPNDVVGKKAPLPDLRPGELVGVLRSGAYGPTASPVHFLSHGYPAEVLVDGGRAHLIRERDDVEVMLGRQRLFTHDAASTPA